MFSCVIVCLLLGLAYSRSPLISREFVEHINQNAKNWVAHENKGSLVDGATVEEVKKLLGVLPGGPKLARKVYDQAVNLPQSFSAIDRWPDCASISTIRDQSACGSCWAFAAVESMSDRICIVHNKNVSLSAAAMAFCCDSCGYGCGGGYPPSAWQYYQDTGLPEEGCWPYPFPSCDHHIPGSSNPCPSDEYHNQPCRGRCESSWNGPSWDTDLWQAQNVYSVSGESDMMNEIYQHGSVEVAFTVYEDFVTYKSGVYRHTSGEALGGHAVRMLGWGVENGQKYWLVANSWNPHWGDKGFFKILRGSNECGIEDEANAGIPV